MKILRMGKLRRVIGVWWVLLLLSGVVIYGMSEMVDGNCEGVECHQKVTGDSNVSAEGLVVGDESVSGVVEEAESYAFQAEVTRLMDLIINYLYTQKDRSIRELVSNSVDALEKIRLRSYEDPTLLVDVADLEIRVNHDFDARTITVRDTGIGMTKSELINNLGTVAKSGTTNFLEALAEAGDVNLIGQFGVGFYSAFLIADKVKVTSKSPYEDVQYIWESSADSSFTVRKDPEGNTLGRGTEVVLHMKAEATEFLSGETLRNLVSKFSQFMSFPIYVEVEKVIEVEEGADGDISGDDQAAADETTSSDDEGGSASVKEDDEGTVDEDGAAKEKKMVKKTIKEWVHVNPQKAIWLRPKTEVTEDEYLEFYDSISKDRTTPLAWIHFVGEGEVEFKAILYIPTGSAMDAYNSYFQKQTGVKLYVRRVLVADKFDDFLPKYLAFVKGVVDSDDVPINISRDQLQEQKITRLISKRVVRKVITLLMKLHHDHEYEKDQLKNELKNAETEEQKEEIKTKLDTPTKFEKFWKDYGHTIKLGCYEDEINRGKLAGLIQFYSSKSPKEYITLEKYIANMLPDQKDIYYAAGQSVQQIIGMPHIQSFQDKNIEVLFLIDNMEEPCVQKLHSFEGHDLVSIFKNDIAVDDSENAKKMRKKLQIHYQPLIKWFNVLLKDKVVRVDLGENLVKAPCAITAGRSGHSGHLLKVIGSQTFTKKEEVDMMKFSSVFALNPYHPIVVNMLEKVQENPNSQELENLGNVLYDMAMISSGYDLEDPSTLSSKFYSLLAGQEGLDPDVTHVEVDLGTVEGTDDDNDGDDNDDDDDDDDGYDDDDDDNDDDGFDGTKYDEL